MAGMRIAAALLGGALATFMSAHGAQAGTVDDIKARGALNCPVPTGGQAGRLEVGERGRWKGLDVDICRGIATAILGSPEKVNFVPISWAQRFPSIQAKEIDIIVMASGWTLSRDTEIGLDFSMPYFFTGLQFLVRTDSGINTPKQLDGGTICAVGGTTMERQTAAYMAAHGIKTRLVTFEKLDETGAAFLAGRCDAFAMAGDGLSITRSQQPDPNKFKLVPDRPITVEPHAMIVRGGDQDMLNVANWVLTALVKADVLDITSDNLDEVIKTRGSDPEVAILLGLKPGIGKRLKLSETWAQDVIRAVGNYSQIFNRNLGKPHKMAAEYNATYSKGGLLIPLMID